MPVDQTMITAASRPTSSWWLSDAPTRRRPSRCTSYSGGRRQTATDDERTALLGPTSVNRSRMVLTINRLLVR